MFHTISIKLSLMKGVKLLIDGLQLQRGSMIIIVLHIVLLFIIIVLHIVLLFFKQPHKSQIYENESYIIGPFFYHVFVTPTTNYIQMVNFVTPTNYILYIILNFTI